MSIQMQNSLQVQPKSMSDVMPGRNLLQRAAITPTITPMHNSILQRCSNGVECADCRAKRLERESLQRAAVDASSVNGVPPIVHDVLNSSGQPLDAGARAFMEPRFGHDFSGVRVHTDARAAESARSVNALAYTVGRNVVFGTGQYAPGTGEGRKLLAHELTHTIQQSNSGIMSLSKVGDISVSSPGDTSEQEANQTAEAVMSVDDSSLDISTLASSAPAIPSPVVVTQGGGCPKPPTGIGNEQASPECELRSDTVLGEMFLFCLDSDQMQDKEQPHLLSLISFLRGLDVVEVHGYASTEGPKGNELFYNFNLSCKRANSVAAMLISNGIPASKIKTVKHGGTAELGSPDQNRSVVIPLSRRNVTPDLHHTRLRVAAVSLLACAPCNPFTDDGLDAVNPPAKEGAIGSFRMKHWMEAEIASLDGINIDPGSPGIIDTGKIVGSSGYCGAETLANILSSTDPGGPVASSSIHGEGWQWEREMVTQVGAIVPATLPDAPCGFLGDNPRIPPIRNRFFLRLFADGTTESGFISASPFPFHYLYEYGDLKTFGGAPVQPGVDFSTWATSTGVSETESEIGFKALRVACCNKMRVPGCIIECVNNRSEIPSVPFFDPQRAYFACIGAAGGLALSSCPASCNGARFGTSCSTLSRPANP